MRRVFWVIEGGTWPLETSSKSESEFFSGYYSWFKLVKYRLVAFINALESAVAQPEDMLNGLPWDLVYQEWWGEYPPHDRTEYVGLYRDVAYRWHLVKLSLHLDLACSRVHDCECILTPFLLTLG